MAMFTMKQCTGVLSVLFLKNTVTTRKFPISDKNKTTEPEIIAVAFDVLLVTIRSRSVLFSSAIANVNIRKMKSPRSVLKSKERVNCQHIAAATVFNLVRHSYFHLL